MPVSIEEYATPRFIKERERYPWVIDKNYNYKNLTINPRSNLDRHNADRDRGDGWRAPGYNVNHNSIRTEVVNTGTDTTARSFKPY